MKTIYNSDKPISEKFEDKFNRNNFSKRVAETIINRNKTDGLVIGIYGIWGEGKTSILNILEKELIQNDNILIIKFNPWRYTTEDALLLNFLKNISEALDKELNNVKEKIGDFISKYGTFTSFINLDLAKIGESLSDTKLEELKNRVNNFLKECNKKVVIIIDDIDRLDKQELFSIFKLVKLTGDFSNTYYILSFDDEMVASSIGERYANGDKSSGHNFLEKIIQVPLRIPKALSRDLLNYTFELINEVLKETSINLSEIQEQNIGYLISQNILPRITTPRLAVRFSNSLSFLLPLLKGEVNHSDLILFEAIKIFYPKHYEFVKSNSHFFIESYNDFDGRKNSEKVDEIKSHLKELNLKLSKKENSHITKLLVELFPRLNEALHNSYVHNGETKWTKEKKIGSAKYFNRFFLYSVPNNEISDVYFDNFINSISTNSTEKLSDELIEILKQIDSLEFLNKLSYYEDLIEWNKKLKLIKLITINQEKFEDIRSVFNFGASNPKSQAAIIIYRFLKSNSYKEESFDIAKELISINVPFNFSKEILKWLQVGNTEEEILYTPEQNKELNEILLERAILDSKEKKSTIFENYDDYIFPLLSYWYEKDQVELREYVTKHIESNHKFVETLIFCLTSQILSSSNPLPYKIDFKIESYKLVEKYFDIGLINSTLNEILKTDNGNQEAKFFDMEEGQTKLNSLLQFKYWNESSKQA